MEIGFERLASEHEDAVVAIFNHYVRTGTAAFREDDIGKEHFRSILETARNYPAYALKDASGTMVGFCMLKPHKEISSFAETAELMYFLAPDAVGRGLGRAALERLEADARAMGLKLLLASISDENEASLSFHRRRGFSEYGRIPQAGKKFGRYFGVVWMGKRLD